MKKFVALVSVSLLLLALLFKSLAWPGADLLLLLAVGLFYPLYYILDLVAEWKTGKSRLAIVLHFLGALFLAEGLLFKIMHWPGGNDLLIISLGFVLPAFLIVRAIQQPRNEGPTLFGKLLLLALCWFSLFSIMHFPGKVILLAATLILTMFVVLFELLKKEEQPIFQLVKHRHLVNATGIFAFLFFVNSNQLSIQVLNSEVARQFDLQDQIAREIEFGSQNVAATDAQFKASIDGQAAELLKLIDEVKLSLINEVNDGLGRMHFADRQVILWAKPKTNELGIVTLNLAALNDKANYEIPMFRLIGNDFARVSGYGSRIWDQWMALQQNYEKMIAQNANLDTARRSQIIRQLQTIQRNWQLKEYESYYDMRNIHWVARTFDHATVVQAILRLTELQYEVVRLRTLVVG